MIDIALSIQQDINKYYSPSFKDNMKNYSNKQAIRHEHGIFGSDKQEVMKNQYELHKFYLSVLDSMLEKLYHDLQNKDQSLPFKSYHEIYRFGEVMKYFFKYDKLFERYKDKEYILDKEKMYLNNLDFDRNISRLRQDFSMYNQKDIEDNDDTGQKIYFEKEEEEDEEEEKIIVNIKRSDLRIQSSSQRREFFKIESEKDQHMIKEQEKNCQSDLEESSDEISHELSNFGERAEEFSNCYLIGEYTNNKLRRTKSKREYKLRIQMNNALLKFADTGREAFFEKVYVNLQYKEKDQQLFQAEYRQIE